MIKNIFEKIRLFFINKKRKDKKKRKQYIKDNKIKQTNFNKEKKAKIKKKKIKKKTIKRKTIEIKGDLKTYKRKEEPLKQTILIKIPIFKKEDKSNIEDKSNLFKEESKKIINKEEKVLDNTKKEEEKDIIILDIIDKNKKDIKETEEELFKEEKDYKQLPTKQIDELGNIVFSLIKKPVNIINKEEEKKDKPNLDKFNLDSDHLKYLKSKIDYEVYINKSFIELIRNRISKMSIDVKIKYQTKMIKKKTNRALYLLGSLLSFKKGGFIATFLGLVFLYNAIKIPKMIIKTEEKTEYILSDNLDELIRTSNNDIKAIDNLVDKSLNEINNLKESFIIYFEKYKDFKDVIDAYKTIEELEKELIKKKLEIKEMSNELDNSNDYNKMMTKKLEDKTN